MGSSGPSVVKQTNKHGDCVCSRLVNQRLIEGQSQVEELQRSLQEQGSKADDVSTTNLISDQINSLILQLSERLLNKLETTEPTTSCRAMGLLTLEPDEESLFSLSRRFVVVLLPGFFTFTDAAK